MNKAEVREIAQNIGVNMAQKKESQEVCFVQDDYKGFIESRAPKGSLKEGKIITRKGEILGKHEGIHRYTIGQRKGLGIAWEHPLYVIEIDALNNNIIVGKNDDLYSNIVSAKDLTWLNKVPKLDEVVTAKVRYAQVTEEAKIIEINDNIIKLKFTSPQRAVTKGQALVLYREDNELLGGGFII
jgi:tRNA-specific 2-thiouridylase